MLGFTDADFGGTLARHWSFPPDLVEAVAQHTLDVDRLPDSASLPAHVVRARLFARASGVTDGYEDPRGATAESAWSRPPVSHALAQSGGIEGILDRVAAFMDCTGGAD